MDLDLTHRGTLVKSWLATLHGSKLTIAPRLDEPLPGWGPLVTTAVAWHVAYALFAYSGALVIGRQAAEGAVGQAVQQGGTPALVIVTLGFWWGGVALTTLLWWAKVRQLRAAGRA